MKMLIFLIPTLLYSVSTYAQAKVDIYSCSREIPAFAGLVDDYVNRSWAQGQNLGVSRGILDDLARQSSDCTRFQARLQQLVSALAPVVQRTQPRPERSRPQPQPRRDEEDDQIEEQRQRPRTSMRERLRERLRPRNRTNENPRILVVTDEPSAYGARIVQQTFATTAPWNCMGVEVVIEVMDREELDCEARNDGRARIVLCSASASRKAQALRRRLGAKKVLIVADTYLEGGNGGATPVISSNFLQHSPKAGMHEIMHTMGFEDTYDSHAQYATPGGDIMSCTSADCYVRREDWPRIARAMGTQVPESCRDF